MKKKVTILGFLAILFFLPEARADIESATALFQKGNESYEEGNFDQAIEEYQKVLDQGIRNSKVFYNLGNAYFRKNQLGKAILNYRRALSLDPRDEDSIANLRFAKLFTLDKIEEQTALFWGLTILLLGFVVFSSSLGVKIYFDSLKSGVVIAPEAKVRSGPGEDYTLQFTGHEGLEFQIKGEAESWYRIMLPNGVRGWIPKEAVEII